MIAFETTQSSEVWLNPLDVTSIEAIHTGSVVTMNNGSKFYLVLAPKDVAGHIREALFDAEPIQGEYANSN